MHINKVVENEKQVVFYNLEEAAIPPSEVVNIHFAQKSFEGYRILMDIEKLTNQGDRLR